MAAPKSIGSNSTGLYKARETEAGKLPQNATWKEKEPNEYGDFGASYNKVARQPINASRQVSKRTVVGYDAAAGFTSDVTPANMLDDIEEFLFANARRKKELAVTAVTATGYTVALDGDTFAAGTLVFVSGCANEVNNGLHIVGNGSTETEIKATGLAAEAGVNALIVEVGFQFAAGDASISIVNGKAAIGATAKTLTDFGLIPGEVVFLGGDSANTIFANNANRGWCRVFSANEDAIVFDKTDAQFIADDGAGKTVQLFFGRVVKNEAQSSLQRTITCAFRRSLGVPDTTKPDIVQSQVILGCTANELTLTLPEEDKLTYEVAYLGREEMLFDNDALVDENGTIKGVDEADAFNSTRDLCRFQTFSINPNKTLVPIFAGYTEGEIAINNNNTARKALATFGTYDVTPGTFEVTGSLSAYFTSVDELRAVKENRDLTIMACLYKDNAGVAIDIPLLDFTTDGLEISLNDPVILPIDKMASRGKKYNANMDHTILFAFFPYLPAIASI